MSPLCRLPGCPATPVTQWRRRLTENELATAVAAEQGRRDELTALADPQLPPPDFGPMPTASDYVRAVFACGKHAIDLDLAARIHQASCATAEPGQLPDCGCTPEPPPTPSPDPGSQPTTTLPTGWVVPAST
jgi:hypothetical protein